jgi:hypothetical protein
MASPGTRFFKIKLACHSRPELLLNIRRCVAFQPEGYFSDSLAVKAQPC